jgi:hypothetical protein
MIARPSFCFTTNSTPALCPLVRVSRGRVGLTWKGASASKRRGGRVVSSFERSEEVRRKRQEQQTDLSTVSFSRVQDVESLNDPLPLMVWLIPDELFLLMEEHCRESRSWQGLHNGTQRVESNLRRVLRESAKRKRERDMMKHL